MYGSAQGTSHPPAGLLWLDLALTDCRPLLHRQSNMWLVMHFQLERNTTYAKVRAGDYSNIRMRTTTNAPVSPRNHPRKLLPKLG